MGRQKTATFTLDGAPEISLMKIRLSPFAGSVFVHSARSIKISHVKKVIR